MNTAKNSPVKNAVARFFLMWIGACLGALLLTLPAWSGPLDETRYCSAAPLRDSHGSIIRSAAVLAAFRHLYPCPSTGQTTGACPGWNIDHTIPLACGGCDAVFNLSWMPVQIKRCAGQYCKDRWERKVYCRIPV